jgi:hypothetical protein
LPFLAKLFTQIITLTPGSQSEADRGVCRRAEGGVPQDQDEPQEGGQAGRQEVVLHALEGVRTVPMKFLKEGLLTQKDFVAVRHRFGSATKIRNFSIMVSRTTLETFLFRVAQTRSETFLFGSQVQSKKKFYLGRTTKILPYDNLNCPKSFFVCKQASRDVKARLECFLSKKTFGCNNNLPV